MRKLLIILILLISSFQLKAQLYEDTLAIAEIKNVFLLASDTLQFDVYVERFSNDWRYWENGTFQFEFTEFGEEYDYNNIEINEVPNSTELLPEVFPGLPPYNIWTGIFDNRFSIFVLGPKTLDNFTKYVDLDQPIRIASFKINTKDGSEIPDFISWKRPINKWQSNAFKVDDINLIPPNLKYFEIEEDDNIEMNDRLNELVLYRNDDAERPEFEFDYFIAEYAGAKDISFEWSTITEVGCVGFNIYKAIRTDFAIPPKDLDYNQLVATYRINDPLYSSDLEGQFYSLDTTFYTHKYDTVQYRGGEYCYKLTYIDNAGTEIDLAYSCVRVPNAVIISAAPSQNPFQEQTNIEYELEDDVYLTIEVYDAIGRFVKILPNEETGQPMSNVYKKKGKHSTVFQAKELSSQGMYSVIITAVPINDASVEISRAIVKTQYIRK